MFGVKNNLVIGMVVQHRCALNLSVPALARLGEKFTLIIFNNDPAHPIQGRFVRRLGYRGGLQIINTDVALGALDARLVLIDAATNAANGATWMIFVAQDGILVSADTSPVAPENFAIIKNALCVRHGVHNLLAAACDGATPVPDGSQIILHGPNTELAGTPVRIDVLRRVADAVRRALPGASDIEDRTADEIIWRALGHCARAENPCVAPIFMDKTAYIFNGIDMCDGRNARTLATCDALVRDAIDAAAAAPAGLD